MTSVRPTARATSITAASSGVNGSFPAPLDRAAHARYLLGRPPAGLGHLLHGLEQVTARALRRGFLARLVEPAAVLQFQPAVEAKAIRGAHRAIGLCHLLAG